MGLLGRQDPAVGLVMHEPKSDWHARGLLIAKEAQEKGKVKTNAKTTSRTEWWQPNHYQKHVLGDATDYKCLTTCWGWVQKSKSAAPESFVNHALEQDGTCRVAKSDGPGLQTDQLFSETTFMHPSQM